jgi:outer membrane immunogenic protein
MRRLGPGLFVGVMIMAMSFVAMFFVAMSAVAISAVAASAADLPMPGAPPVAPAYRPAIYDWSGIYIGGQVGAATMNDTFTAQTTTALLNAGTTTQTNPWSVVGGAEAGINFQFAPVVVGFEGTWTSSYLSGTQVQAAVPAATSIFTTSASHWYATATARLGYAANDFLFYVKGGGAWVRVVYSEQPYSFNQYNVMQSIADTRTGWTIGGGVEYGLTENLSLKVEYDFFDFGSRNYNFNALSFQPTTGGTTAIPAFPVGIKSISSMVTAGVNYRFNWH